MVCFVHFNQGGTTALFVPVKSLYFLWGFFYVQILIFIERMVIVLDESEYTLHFGVYGVVIEQGHILCIHKNSGPYKNRYDLPGGSQEPGEGLTETLVREVYEETGQKVKKYSHPRIYDTFIKPHTKQVTTHHVFVLYTVSLHEEVSDLPLYVADGLNDSDGVTWVKISELNELNASPLILKVLDEQSNKETTIDKSRYEHWTVIDKKLNNNQNQRR